MTQQHPIFIMGFKRVLSGDCTKSIPVYGNFCPNCFTSSDNVIHHTKGLLTCSKCDHIFQMQDIQNKIQSTKLDDFCEVEK